MYVFNPPIRNVLVLALVIGLAGFGVPVLHAKARQQECCVVVDSHVAHEAAEAREKAEKRARKAAEKAAHEAAEECERQQKALRHAQHEAEEAREKFEEKQAKAASLASTACDFCPTRAVVIEEEKIEVIPADVSKPEPVVEPEPEPMPPISEAAPKDTLKSPSPMSGIAGLLSSLTGMFTRR